MIFLQMHHKPKLELEQESSHQISIFPKHSIYFLFTGLREFPLCRLLVKTVVEIIVTKVVFQRRFCSVGKKKCFHVMSNSPVDLTQHHQSDVGF